MMQLPRNWWRQMLTAVRTWVSWPLQSRRIATPAAAPQPEPAPAPEPLPEITIVLPPDLRSRPVEPAPAPPAAPARDPSLEGTTWPEGVEPIPDGYVKVLADPFHPTNRSERRKKDRETRLYERRRRRFDKFVQPQGEPPQAPERTVPAPPPPPLPPPAPAAGTEPEADFADDGDDFLIVDKHHSDRQTYVLYDVREVWGEFNFRDTVLDQLERYFVYLDRMKKHDKDAYQFYGHVGAQLVPYSAVSEIMFLHHERERDDDDGWKKLDQLSPGFSSTARLLAASLMAPRRKSRRSNAATTRTWKSRPSAEPPTTS